MIQKIQERNYGIELLRFIAIIAIIISHCANTFVGSASRFGIENLCMPTYNLPNFLIIIFLYLGNFANIIFIVSSSWFLIDKNNCNMRKWLLMVIETWLISITYLVIFKYVLNFPVSADVTYISILPISLSANWYISCYLIIYPLHKYINIIINSINKNELGRLSIVMMILYTFCSFVRDDVFFYTPLMFWIAVYFLIAYLKKYHRETMNNLKINAVLLLITVSSFMFLMVLSNIIGLRYVFFSSLIMRWNKICNPFFTVAVICLFNIFRNINVKINITGYLSSLSLLVYLFHENINVRLYFRPVFVEYLFIYSKSPLICIVISSIIVLIVTYILCVLYDKTLRRIVKAVVNLTYSLISNILFNFERKVGKNTNENK